MSSWNFFRIYSNCFPSKLPLQHHLSSVGDLELDGDFSPVVLLQLVLPHGGVVAIVALLASLGPLVVPLLLLHANPSTSRSFTMVCRKIFSALSYPTLGSAFTQDLVVGGTGPAPASA